MTDRTITKEEYRFNEEEHLHEILIDGVWVAMTGVSSVVKDMVNYGVAAYYGSRRALMALGYDPKDAPNELKDFYHTISLIGTEENTKDILQKAYKAHATYSKARATKGTNSHDIVDKWIKLCIKDNKGYPILESEEPVVKKFLELTKDKMPYRFIASEKHGFNRELFIAGICDVIVETKNGIGIWDLKDRPAIYGKDLIQMGGYTLLFPLEFTHILGIPLEGKETRGFYDIEQLRSVFTSQLNVYRFMQSVEPVKKYK